MSDIGNHLLDAVNEAARTARSSMLFLLVVGLYLLIMAGLTTDVILLKGEIVNLPFMQVGIPVVTFYIAAPLLFWMLHVNLLIRLRQLASTVRVWENHANTEKLDPKVQKSLVFPFDFVRLLLNDDMRWVLRIVVLAQVAILPVVVLIILQMKFLAYQHTGITLWHQLIATFDIASLLYITRTFVLKTFFQKLISISAAIIILTWVWLIAVVPDSRQGDFIYFVITVLIPIILFLRLFWISIDSIKDKSNKKLLALPVLSVIIFTSVLLFQQKISAYVFDDWWEVSLSQQQKEMESQQQKETESQQQKETDYYQQFAEWWDKLEFSPFPQRYLDIQPHLLIKDEKDTTEIKGKNDTAEIKDKDDTAEIKDKITDSDVCRHYRERLYLTERKLRYAKLNHSPLKCAVLEKADLFKADLSGADLSGAHLFKADLSGADLNGVDLSEAHLILTKLNGADLSELDLNQIDFSKIVDLIGRHGFKEVWETAASSKVDLSGANLYAAELYGVNLRGANLRKTHWVYSFGAHSFEAELYGVNLVNVILDEYTKWCSVSGEQCAKLQYIDISGASVPSTSTYLLPELQTPHCVLYDNTQKYFEKWKNTEFNCAETVRNDTDILCKTPEATKEIVDMAIRIKDKDEDKGAFIRALLNKLNNGNCPTLEEYREKLQEAS